MNDLPESARELLVEALSRSGQRLTRQREQVFAVLLRHRDHPTADEVHLRVREEVPGISLATVYNCLETLVECGLVRHVNFERESTRFCPNLSEHAHFHDRETGRVYDIDLPTEVVARLRELLPEGFAVESVELAFHGSTRSRDQNRSRHGANAAAAAPPRRG